MYEAARVGPLVADVILDVSRRIVWVVCTSLPAPKLQIRDAATDTLLQCVKVSSLGGECPSAILAFGYISTPNAVTVNDGEEIELEERASLLRKKFARLPDNAVVLTTLFKHDADNLNSYVDHYMAKGAHGFLLYDNHPFHRPELNAIHWPLEYWEKPGVHRAQSTQLTHAALLCAVFGRNTWLLNVDLDEYVMTPMSLPDIVEVATLGKCDVVGFRSVWADSETHGVEAVAKAPHTIRKAPFYFTWPHRSKYMQQHVIECSMLRDIPKLHRGIHHPATGAKKLIILEPDEGHVLHFAFASGAPRNPGLFFLHQPTNLEQGAADLQAHVDQAPA